MTAGPLNNFSEWQEAWLSTLWPHSTSSSQEFPCKGAPCSDHECTVFLLRPLRATPSELGVLWPWLSYQLAGPCGLKGTLYFATFGWKGEG